jgi:hypothetical protein
VDGFRSVDIADVVDQVAVGTDAEKYQELSRDENAKAENDVFWRANPSILLAS